ncbi:MAG TPA: hypothetical protein VFN71_10950 [Methylomirabilota bacterium]|nr:hypothetical protein [Methylomirabilota bacterium]
MPAAERIRGVGAPGGRVLVDRKHGSSPGQPTAKPAPVAPQVFVDGRLVGTAADLAPGLGLPPGRHVLEVALPGYKPFTAEFTASREAPARFRAALARE